MICLKTLLLLSEASTRSIKFKKILCLRINFADAEELILMHAIEPAQKLGQSAQRLAFLRT